MSTTLEAMQRWRADDARDTLRRYPELRPERIAAHYCYTFATAQMLRALVQQRQHAPRDADLKETDAAIAHLTRQLQEQHLMDLGLPLDWP